MVKSGRISVNGKKIEAPGFDIGPDDVVKLDGRRLYPDEEKLYIALNKPVGFVTSLDDEYDRPTVVDLLNEFSQRLFPVGRLDYNTSGLLIMTNDGDFAYEVSHPKYEVPKTYRALVEGGMNRKKLGMLTRGVDIDGFVTSPAQVKIEKDMGKMTLLVITIHEGKNRQVRRMFEALGNRVAELERISIGDVRLGRLKSGGWRKLSEAEIASLRGEAKPVASRSLNRGRRK